MRKPVLVVGLVCLCATVALAQGKVANGWACGKPAMGQSIEVGDQPNHAYAIDQIKCTSTKGEIAGVKEKVGTGTEFAEVTGNSFKGHGVFVETMANGDKVHSTYQITATLKNGQIQSGSDKADHRRNRQVQRDQGQRHLHRNGGCGRGRELDLHRHLLPS